ncbi:hypothetical protein ABZ370_08750 [Streptomyces sp. NPDC005962]|uniref:hypothetical protein n=1 Tax=Streptomyces sp. NPDC005962 TaxID=3154466 RepID=UPI0034011852
MEDETNDQLDDVADSGHKQQVTFTPDRLGKVLTREKAQGERAAIKRLLSQLGFDSPKSLTEFIMAQREAEQAALSEVDRREQAAAERELQAACREELAAERERAALRRAAAVALGAEGVDLVDAERLLAVDDEDPDELQIQSAAEALRARRPELFGEVPTPVPRPPPAHRPGAARPVRQPGPAGLDMAKRRGPDPGVQRLRRPVVPDPYLEDHAAELRGRHRLRGRCADSDRSVHGETHMTIQPVSKSEYTTANREWLASLHGTDSVDTITLDLNLFCEGKHYVCGGGCDRTAGCSGVLVGRVASPTCTAWRRTAAARSCATS